MKRSLCIFFFALLLASAPAQNYSWAWAHECKGLINPKLETWNDQLFLTATFQGSCSVNGQVISSPHPQAGFVARLDASGTVLWYTHFGAQALHIADIQTHQSKIYLAGTFQGTLTGYAIGLNSAGASDIFMLRLDMNGNVELAVRDGGAQDELAVAFDADTALVVLGQFSAGGSLSGHALDAQASGTNNVFFAKYSALNGSNRWVQDIVSQSNTPATAIAVRFDRNGDIVLQGEFGGAMDYAGTVDGFCQLCHPLLRFKGSDGSLAGFLMDTQDGNGGPHKMSADWEIDAGNYIYNHASYWCNICNHALTIEKHAPAGSQLYAKQILANSGGNQPTGSSRPVKLYASGLSLYAGAYSSGTVHINGTSETVTGDKVLVMRLDTSLSYQGGGTAIISGTNRMNDLAADVQGNIFITGTMNGPAYFGTITVNAGSSNNSGYIAKLGNGSPVTGLTRSAAKTGPVLSPNPTSGLLRISGGHAGMKVCVYNVAGLCVYSGSLSVTEIDLSAQPDGIYLVEVTGAAERFTRKIIKN